MNVEMIMQAIHNLIVMAWMTVFIGWIAVIALISAGHKHKSEEE